MGIASIRDVRAYTGKIMIPCRLSEGRRSVFGRSLRDAIGDFHGAVMCGCSGSGDEGRVRVFDVLVGGVCIGEESESG